jgi:hypothetical protein
MTLFVFAAVGALIWLTYRAVGGWGYEDEV